MCAAQALIQIPLVLHGLAVACKVAANNIPCIIVRYKVTIIARQMQCIVIPYRHH